MIIKSLSRKSPSFAQLYDYISQKGTGDFALFHNIGGLSPGRGDVLRSLYRNERRLPKRKNGNALYHELISIPRNPCLSVEHHTEILCDLSQRYLSLRAPGQLAYGRLHVEGHHLHVHLMLSSNDLGSSRRVRLERAAFLTIQQELERYCLSHYPELEDRVVYGKPIREMEATVTGNEFEVKCRTKAPSKKEKLRERLREVFEAARFSEELNRLLEASGISLTKRGRDITAKQGGLCCRLSRLGLREAYNRCKVRLEGAVTGRMEELSKVRNRNGKGSITDELEWVMDAGLSEWWF